MQVKNKFTGLSDAEVLSSRSKYGQNVLTPPQKEPLWKQFLGKFSDPLIIILLIAGALSIGISLYEYLGLGMSADVFFEPVGIFIAIILATGLAFYFEYQAEKEFAILNQVNDNEQVEVIRNGGVKQIPRCDVVVGDYVLLQPGEEVAADGELIECAHLSVDESTLTGEPVARKTVDASEFDKEATYPSNHVLKGTKVMEGHGVFCVTAVGDNTEQGKVFEAAQIDNSTKTPLNEQLEGLSRVITKISYAFAAIIVVSRIALYFVNGGAFAMDSWAEIAPFVAFLLQTLMVAVTLIVVAVPEGLPMAVTLSLAYSMRRMLKTNNLVRKMHACETMGATTVICTDKTGTLTENRMRVDEIKLFLPDVAQDLVHEGIAANSTAHLDISDKENPKVLGNPTEGALLIWLWMQNANYSELRRQVTIENELPFSTERKFMATVVRSAALPGKRVLYVKGAPEIVFQFCNQAEVDSVALKTQLQSYQQRAMRTLGFAYLELDDAEQGIDDGKLNVENLHFIGVAAIADPVRADVPAAVGECLEAGIDVKIVTGDTPGTAKEIGRQIGLWNSTDSENQIITGPEFAQLSDEELLSRVQDLKIIARARPMDKKRLVEALQQRNEVVAVTGDGTNDAPALKAAHVGLSMGDGTSVAKEASDITIIDNSFSSIGKAVMWGRSLYQNIQRFLLFQLTVNVTACFLVLFGAFMGTESPLTVTQMLWINLIMDTFAAMALASLPPEKRVMREKPRNRNAFILNKAMIREVVGVGGIFFIMLIVLLYIFQHADIQSLTDLLTLQLGAKGHVSPYELTLLFTIFVMTHFFYLFNARAFATGRSALHFQGCKGLLTIVAIIIIGQVVMVETPGLQKFFNVCGLSLQDWVIITIGSSLVLWIREGWHLITIRR